MFSAAFDATHSCSGVDLDVHRFCYFCDLLAEYPDCYDEQKSFFGLPTVAQFYARFGSELIRGLGFRVLGVV